MPPLRYNKKTCHSKQFPCRTCRNLRIADLQTHSDRPACSTTIASCRTISPNAPFCRSLVAVIKGKYD